MKAIAVIRAVLTVGFVFALVGIGNIIVSSNDAFAEAHRANESAIASLQEQLQSAESEEVSRDFGPEQMVANLTSAATLGNKVADLQNRYATVEVNTPEFDEVVASLDACFAKADSNARSKWLSGGDAGTWKFMSGFDYEDSAIDAVWLAYNDEGDIVGYACGVYDKGSDVFTDMNWGITSTTGVVPSDEPSVDEFAE